jgi:CysZ protein
MKFFSNFFSAAGNCFAAFTIIFNKGLWPFLFYPLFVWIITWLFALFGIAVLADQVSAWLNNYCDFDSIPDNGHWLSFAKPFLTGYFSVLIVWVIKVLLWFISGTLSKYITLIVLSPLLALLSEKTGEIMGGKKTDFSLLGFIKDIGRGILISLRNMIMEYVFVFVCFLFTFLFPPLAFITTPFILFLSWYYTGFTMLDYSSERHKFGVKESVNMVRANKGYACGIGCVYWLWMLLPTFLGSVTGIMFGPALAIVGATLTFLQIKNINYPNQANINVHRRDAENSEIN